MLVNSDLQDQWIPRYFRLALINMLSNLMVPLSGMVSVAFLGHLQDIRHLAGVALATVLFNYLYRAFNFLRLSVTGTTAQATGRNDREEVLLLGLRNVLIALSLGLAVLILQYPLRELGFVVLNSDPQVKAAGVDYFNMRIWGAPAVLVNMVLLGWLMGREQNGKVLSLSIFGNVANIILSYHLIVQSGLNSMGAGLAQALSQSLMMVLGLIWVKSEIQWQELRAVAPQLWNKSAWNQTFALSWDLFVRTLVIWFTYSAFTNLFAGMGVIAFAENILLIEFMMLGIHMLNGLSYATEILAGSFDGTKEQGKMVPLLSVSVGVSLVFAVAIAFTCILFPQTVFGLLTNHTEVTTQIEPYVPWLMSVLGLYAFAVSIEAYFFGLAEGLILRNAAFIATGLGFIPTAALAWKLQSVHLLWLAMSLFIVTRAGVQGIQIPRTLKLAAEDIASAQKTQPSDNSLTDAQARLNIPEEEEVFIFPASFAQQRLWFIDQLVPGNSFYNVPTALRLTGSLHLSALERTFCEIVGRHEALRTRFGMVEGQLVQAIPAQSCANAPTLTINLPVIDLRELPAEERELQAKQLVTEESQRPFDLAIGPLLRLMLLKLDETEHILLLNLHHIICDDWSIGVLIRELSAIYTAFAQNQPSPLSELPLQYADFAHWQREWLQGEELETQLAYWRQHLRGMPVLNLPSDRPKPSSRDVPPERLYRGATKFLELSPSLSEALEKLSQREGATLFMTLLAAFQTLLYRYTQQEDIAVGSPIANRNRSEIEGLIGFFVNSLVLRSDLSGNPTFLELLGRVREVTLGAYAHQDLPFEKLVEELHPERSLSRHPLFQVVFGFENAPMEALELPGLKLNPLNIDFKTTRFDLEFHLWEASEGFRSLWGEQWQYSQGIRGVVTYNTDLFDEATITRMLGHFKTLLEGIVANPQTRIANLPLLLLAERHQLLVQWNDTQGDYPQHMCIHQLFEEQVEHNSEAIAVIYEDKQLTYRELNSRSNQLAHYLQKLGVGSEVLVGICMERSVEMIVGLLGILKAGGAYVPLDPSYPQERLSFMLEDSQISVLLTQEKLVEQLPDIIASAHQDCTIQNPGRYLSRRWNSEVSSELGSAEEETSDPDFVPLLFENGFAERYRVPKSKIQNPKVICLDTDWNTITQESPKNPISSVTSDNLAYVIYTSGSTGKPKGVAVPHKAVNRLVFKTNYINLDSSDKIAQVSNTSFDAATFEIWGALLHGAQLIGMSRDVTLSPHDFALQLRQKGITVLFLTTALFQQIARDVPQAFESLRYLLFGGEAVAPRWVKKILNKEPPKQLIHVYGPTEGTTFSSFYWVQDVPEEATSIPIGRPITNTQIYLLDEQLQPVPIGVPGELYIGGDGLARGYLNRPELTAEHFISNPFSKEKEKIKKEKRTEKDSSVLPFTFCLLPSCERLYKTGDLARYRPDGNIEFLGRIDNQVKIRGFRIELGEIEAVLNQHPAVRETVVIVQEDIPGDKHLVAYIVPNQEQTPTVEAQSFASLLRQFLKEKLPGYMVPSAYMVLNSLPLTPNGKVDRRVLPEVDILSLDTKEDYVAPRTTIEEELARIWCQVLGRQQVGVHDNFFELGGHSLLATQLMSRIRDAFQVELSVRHLFEAPTVASLAKHIETICWATQGRDRTNSTSNEREEMEF